MNAKLVIDSTPLCADREDISTPPAITVSGSTPLRADTSTSTSVSPTASTPIAVSPAASVYAERIGMLFIIQNGNAKLVLGSTPLFADLEVISTPPAIAAASVSTIFEGGLI